MAYLQTAAVVKKMGGLMQQTSTHKRSKEYALLSSRNPQLEPIEGKGKPKWEGSNNTEKLVLAGKLAASFAHSIKNPLTSIKMRLFSLQRIDPPPDQKDDLKVIVEEIGNIENMVRDFLEFSKLSILKKEKISPSDVVDKVVRLLAPDMQRRKIQLHVYRSQRLPEIWIDAERFKEALVNLVINGFEGIGNGNGSVFIHEKKVKQAFCRRSVVIEVHDNGDGIPEFVQARIFDPFFTTKEEGTGLGLSIAKRIVEAHGGNLTFESEEKKSTKFSIIFPY